MESFILKIGEIKAWLEKTEDSLLSFSSLPSGQKDDAIQVIIYNVH